MAIKAEQTYRYMDDDQETNNIQVQELYVHDILLLCTWSRNMKKVKAAKPILMEQFVNELWQAKKIYRKRGL